MLDVGHTDLRKSFLSLKSSATLVTREEHQLLLMFYAVECGLKSILLRARKLSTWCSHPHAEHLRHDLGALAAELRLGACSLGPPPHFQLAKGIQRCPLKLAHEAWRYGISLDLLDQAAVKAWLEAARRLIEARI